MCIWIVFNFKDYDGLYIFQKSLCCLQDMKCRCKPYVIILLVTERFITKGLYPFKQRLSHLRDSGPTYNGAENMYI